MRQRRVNSIDRIDDVRAGLAKHDDQHRGLAVDHPGRANVLDRIPDPRDVRKLNRGAIGVANDERSVVVGLEELVGRAQPPSLAVIGKFALGTVRIGPGKDGPHVLETDAEVAHLRGIQLDANARQRASADINLADAFELRELLLEDRI